jgi:hypothetical protein
MRVRLPRLSCGRQYFVGISAMPDDVIGYIEKALFSLTAILKQFINTFFGFLLFTSDFEKEIGLQLADHRERGAPGKRKIVPPLSYFVLLFFLHLVFAQLYVSLIVNQSRFPSVYWTTEFVSQIKYLEEFLDGYSGVLGQLFAVAVLSTAIALIIEIKAMFVCSTSVLFGHKLRFEIVLMCSAYAIGTFIIFQYLFIAAIAVSDGAFGPQKQIDRFEFVYLTLLSSCVLVYRIIYLMGKLDKQDLSSVFISWFVGTAIWQFVVVYISELVLGRQLSISIVQFLSDWAGIWGIFFKAFVSVN